MLLHSGEEYVNISWCSFPTFAVYRHILLEEHENTLTLGGVLQHLDVLDYNGVDGGNPRLETGEFLQKVLFLEELVKVNVVPLTQR